MVNLLSHDFSGTDSLLSKLTKKENIAMLRTLDLFNLLLKRKTEHIISLEKIYGFCSILIWKKIFNAEFFQNILNIFSHKCSVLSKTITINHSNFYKANHEYRSLYFLILRSFPNVSYNEGLSIQITCGQLKFNFNLGDYRYTKLLTFTSNFL